MKRIYEFFLILIVGLFVYIVIDNATDRIIIDDVIVDENIILE